MADAERREWQCEIEAPVGYGFCDVLATKTTADGQRVAIIFEAKSHREQFSAGDLVRQLKWYRAQLLRGPVKFQEIMLYAGFETRSHAENFGWILRHEGIVLKWMRDDIGDAPDEFAIESEQQEVRQ